MSIEVINKHYPYRGPLGEVVRHGKIFFASKDSFPVGKYTPAYEDDHGFYFEASRKVLVDDIATYAFDGGVIVERGQTEPTHWYIIRPNGRRSTGKFRTMPVYKIVQ